MCYKTLKKVVRITLLNNSDHLILFNRISFCQAIDYNEQQKKEFFTHFL